MIKSIENKVVSSLSETFLPDYVNVDGRSIQEIMQLFTEYAKQIPFVNENKQHLGFWDEMYTEQTLFIWVDILCMDIDSFDTRKKTILEHWLLDGESKALALLDDVLETLRRLFTKAKNVNAPWVVDEITAVMGDDLFENVNRLKSELVKRKEGHEIMGLYSRHDWLFNETHSNIYKSSTYKKDLDKKNLFLVAINNAINCLYVLKKRLSSQEFNKMLGNGKHPAHIGLLYGFLKSYKLIQNRFNQLPKRHLDYYYKTILKLKPLSAQPDFTYLFVKLVPGLPFLKIKSEMPFIASQDENGNDIIYESTQEFNLSSAKIAELKTLLFNKSDVIIPLKNAKMVTGIYMDSILPAEVNNSVHNPKGWPLCGKPLLYEKHKALPDMGWAIGAPIFFLDSGDRQIKVSFEITNESLNAFYHLLFEMQKHTEDSECVSDNELLYHFSNNAFDLQISSSLGMFRIEQYVVSFPNITNKKHRLLNFQFTLSAKDPSWIPYNKIIHGTKFAASLPILSINLKQETVYYPYSFLNKLNIESLNIDVNVTNFKKPIIYNKHGIVDSSSPFPILGMNPLKGNMFYLGAKEWQYKKITSLDIKINWLDLPNPNLTEYYKNYANQPITNDCFDVSLNDTTTNVSLGSLFTVDEEDNINTTTVFKNITINKLPDKKEIIEAETLSPSQVPLSFVSVKLENPDIGFGSDIYQEEMALYGQRLIRDRKQKELAMSPQRPFIPMAKSVIINYQSKSRISFNNKSKVVQTQPFAFFHMHPYGVIKVADDKKIGVNTLLPEYDEKGNLFIGLENAVPLTELSIYMKLIPSNEPSKKQSSQNKSTKIQYLNGTYWKEIPSESIVNNSTFNFQESGTIRIILPEDIKSNHPLFDIKKNWLRLSFESDYISALGRCVYIKTNVVKVKRKLEKENPIITILNPLSISGLLRKNKSIQSLIQPFYSFNGRQQEEEERFYSRISNRLGHKNRMVRARDYKRMILERFPVINWIKVLTPSRYPETISPGKIIIIVIPKIKNMTDFSNYFVRKRTRIKAQKYVEKHCAPGLEIMVYPPNYETVEVRCSLKLKTTALMTFKKEISSIINKQIAPWLFNYKTEYKQVSTKFSVGNLINKINQHPNVEEVYTCQVIRISNTKKKCHYFDSVTDGEIIMPSDERSVLIPARTFEINQVGKSGEEEEKLSFGTMAIGKDLILMEHKQKNKELGLTKKRDQPEKRYLLSIKI